MSDESTWVTDEDPPRRMTVRGTSAIDPDVLVAEFEDGSKSCNGGKTFWIVKHSGYVCGISSIFESNAPSVYARQTRDVGSSSFARDALWSCILHKRRHLGRS